MGGSESALPVDGTLGVASREAVEVVGDGYPGLRVTGEVTVAVPEGDVTTEDDASRAPALTVVGTALPSPWIHSGEASHATQHTARASTILDVLPERVSDLVSLLIPLVHHTVFS
jgi:hypothetical protein